MTSLAEGGEGLQLSLRKSNSFVKGHSGWLANPASIKPWPLQLRYVSDLIGSFGLHNALLTEEYESGSCRTIFIEDGKLQRNYQSQPIERPTNVRSFLFSVD